MLRIYQQTSVDAAKSYYSTADYYSQGDQTIGRWGGKGAAMLGLAGTIEQQDWDALCENRHPETGDKLTQRTKSNRRIGWDFNWNVPKSLSVVEAFTGDERLKEAIREAACETMLDVEEEVKTRVTVWNGKTTRVTGNLVWGEYLHLESRPVDGICDPNLHVHAFVMNSTFDPVEQKWKALELSEIKRDAPFYEAMFHNRLAQKVQVLGYAIERTNERWELVGIPKSMRDKFSKRTQEIEANAKKLGIIDAKSKDQLGAKTRSGKQELKLTPDELLKDWRSRLSLDEEHLLHQVARQSHPLQLQAGLTKQAVAHALKHCFERKSVISEKRLLAEALRFGVGQVTLDDVKQEMNSQGVLVREHRGQQMATTEAILAEELRMLRFAREGRGACDPLVGTDQKLECTWLNADQQKAVRHLWETTDRVAVVRGAAGVGKTTLLQEAVAGIEQHGIKVYVFAPTAEASRKVLREEGFKDAETLARLLIDPALQRAVQDQVILIDEASLVSSRQMAQVFNLAETANARVILIGDKNQHGSVERGAVLRLLETEAGIIPAEVLEIQRQKETYKQAVRLLSEGYTAEGFEYLEAMNWIKEIPSEERYQQLATDYVAALQAGTPFQKLLVISPTHSEGNVVTEELRTELKKVGLLGKRDQEVAVLRNVNLTVAERGDRAQLQAGDVLQYHQNAIGHRSGERFVVREGMSLPLDQAERYQVYRQDSIRLAEGDLIRITKGGMTQVGKHRLNNGDVFQLKGFTQAGHLQLNNGWVLDKAFGHIAHGLVSTSQKSQGKTVDRAFVAIAEQSLPAVSKESFYVSLSRSKFQVTVYTDNKEALREAIQKSDLRLTATELLVKTGLRPERSKVQELNRQRRLYRSTIDRSSTVSPHHEQREMMYDR
jgi:conjugative relaxase-like TrwC/TraI family protein